MPERMLAVLEFSVMPGLEVGLLDWGSKRLCRRSVSLAVELRGSSLSWWTGLVLVEVVEPMSVLAVDEVEPMPVLS
jgi:hypothetical protein